MKKEKTILYGVWNFIWLMEVLQKIRQSGLAEHRPDPLRLSQAVRKPATAAG